MTKIEARQLVLETETNNQWIHPVELVCKVHNHEEDPLVVDKDNKWWVAIYFEQQQNNTRAFYDFESARCYIKGVEMGIKHIAFLNRNIYPPTG